MKAEADWLCEHVALVRVFAADDASSANLDDYQWFTTATRVRDGAKLKGFVRREEDAKLTGAVFIAIAKCLIAEGLEWVEMQRHGKWRRITREQAERWMR